MYLSGRAHSEDDLGLGAGSDINEILAGDHKAENLQRRGILKIHRR